MAPRLVGALAVAVYVAGLGGLGATIYGDRLGGRPTIEIPVESVEAQDKELLDRIRAVPGVEVADIESMRSTMDDGVLLADCADIEAMFRVVGPTSCVDGLTYRLAWDFGNEMNPAGQTVATEDGWTTVAPERILSLELRYNIGYGAGLLVTRTAPESAGLTISDSHANVIVGDPATWDRVAQVVAANAPAATWQGALRQIEWGLDASLLNTLLTTGLVVGLGLGLATFVVAAADRRVERRRGTTALAVIGASPRVNAVSEFAHAVVPLVLGLLLATAATALMALSLAQLLDVSADVVLDLVGPALRLGGAALAIGVVLVALAALRPPVVTAASLRRM